jgi:hypothetical protein
LTGSAFTSIFNSWDARNGDLGIASSTYQGTATDAGSRGATGKDPGADLTTIASLLNDVHASVVYKTLSISSGTLTAATHNVPYQNALATPSYGSTGGGASPYKSWWQETDTSHCGGNCGTTMAALVAAGIMIGRDGRVNGPFTVLTISRASAVSTLTPKMQMVSEMPATPTIPWQVGQIVTMSGFVNVLNFPDFVASHSYAANAKIGPATNNPGSYDFQTTAGGTSGSYPSSWNQSVGGTTTDSGGVVWTNIGADNSNKAHDTSFNGSCTITSVAANNYSCTQSGTGYDNIAQHTPDNAQGGTPEGVVTFAPITPGSYQFWMGVKDGAFQKAWAQISVTVN